MNEEQLRAMLQGHPPSVERRLEWLESDGAAQRTAILKLERACKLLLKIVAALWLICVVLALMVLT